MAKRIKNPRIKSPPKRAVRRPLTIEAVRAALIQECGIYARVAKRFGCDRSNVKLFVDKHSEELQPARKQGREQFLDDGEGGLADAVRKGEPWAIKFLLETLGKRRGYVKQTRLVGPSGEPLPGMTMPIVIMLPDNSRTPQHVQTIRQAPDQPAEARPAAVTDGHGGTDTIPAATGDADGPTVE
jgi:hypothetical protein